MRKYLIVLVTLLLAACGGETAVAPTATAVAQLQPTHTPQPSSTPSPTDTPVPTSTPQPTDTPAPTNTPTPSPEPWQTYAVPTHNYFLALPPGWQELPLDETTLDEALAVLGDHNPQFAQLASSGYVQTLLASGGTFWGVDLSVDSITKASPTNMNVIVEERPSPVTIDFYISLSVGQIENLANVTSPIDTDIFVLDGQEMGKLMYEMTLTMPDGTAVPFRTVQYVIVNDATVYIITLLADTSFSQSYFDGFDEIAATFAIGDAPDDAIITGPPAPPAQAELAQWRLFSLAESVVIAALAQGFDLSDELVSNNWTDALDIADALGITLPDLDTAVATGDSRAGLTYAFDVQEQLMMYAEAELGAQEAAIVELIISSKIAQTLYDPEDREQTAVFLNTLTPAALTSGLDPRLTQTMLDGMESNQSWEEVGDAINLMIFEIKGLFEGGDVDLTATETLPLSQLYALSRQVSLAGLGRGLGADNETVQSNVDEIEALTAVLNIDVPNVIEEVPLGDLREGLLYIIANESRLRTFAQSTYGDDAEAIVIIGIYTVLIDIMYQPDNDALVTMLEESLSEIAPLTLIPSAVFDPIFDGFENGISNEEMQERLEALDQFIEAYVSETP